MECAIVEKGYGEEEDMVALIDYDAGNLKSVEKALVSSGESPVITRDPKIILSADKVILPGVGAYADCMKKLKKYQLVDVLHEVVKKKIPLLGICLGMQLLFDSSEEGMEGNEPVEGLHILEGRVLKIPHKLGYKIPHMGWNNLTIAPNTRLFKGIEKNSYVYFVHSYYLDAKDKAVVAATTDYVVHIDAAVEYGNVFGCQFHPEKSSEIGLKILKNFLEV